MTRDIWFISDTHFGHEAIIEFGKRPYDSVAEMDEALAQNWAERIKPADLVYHLGDIAWTSAGFRVFAGLPGTKRLIIGNHDDGKACAPIVQKLELIRHFSDDDFTTTHMPKRFDRHDLPINVHGHVHLYDIDDPRYLNICVEKTDYRPLHIDELRERVTKAKAEVAAAAPAG